MPYTNDQKIDYIFKEIKAQKRTRYFNLLLKLTVIWFIIFLYFTYAYWVEKEELRKQIVNVIWEMVKPLVKDLATDMIKNNTQEIINKK